MRARGRGRIVNVSSGTALPELEAALVQFTASLAAEVAPETFPPPARAAALVAGLTSGRADSLTGRVLDVGDDLGALVAQADAIVRDRLYVVRRQPERAPPPRAKRSRTVHHREARSPSPSARGGRRASHHSPDQRFPPRGITPPAPG